MSFQEFLRSDPSLQPIDLPVSEKPGAIRWEGSGQYPTTFLPDLRHDSLYANPLSKCRGQLWMRAFCVLDRGTRFARCLSCKEKVEVSISQFLLAKGLI